MYKQEFEIRLEGLKGHAVSVPDEDYDIIEKVYTFHPSISETDGKDQIARLYLEYGMSIIRDMKPRAALMEKKEEELRDVQARTRQLQIEIEEIRNGGEI